nr:hypothetical protein CTI12_AA172970 [Tanacetum cinerariifolium]
NLVVEDDNESMIINNTQAVLDSDEMKKNLVVEDDNESMIINNTQAVLDSDEMKKNVVNEANDLMTIPMLDSDLSIDMSWPLFTIHDVIVPFVNAEIRSAHQKHAENFGYVIHHCNL